MASGQELVLLSGEMGPQPDSELLCEMYTNKMVAEFKDVRRKVLVWDHVLTKTWQCPGWGRCCVAEEGPGGVPGRAVSPHRPVVLVPGRGLRVLQLPGGGRAGHLHPGVARPLGIWSSYDCDLMPDCDIKSLYSFSSGEKYIDWWKSVWWCLCLCPFPPRTIHAMRYNGKSIITLCDLN